MATKAIKIAVVEDNDLSRNLIVNTLLGLTDMDVFPYENGETAWMDLGNDQRADMVISDVNMPQMDGLTLLSNIKKKNPEKPCIIISGNPGYKNTAKALGADCFLEKPFTITALLKAVQQFFV